MSELMKKFMISSIKDFAVFMLLKINTDNQTKVEITKNFILKSRPNILKFIDFESWDLMQKFILKTITSNLCLEKKLKAIDLVFNQNNDIKSFEFFFDPDFFQDKPKAIDMPINPVRAKQFSNANFIKSDYISYDLARLSDLVKKHAKSKCDFRFFKRNVIHFYRFESDVLGITKSNHVHEFEIKTNLADFHADFRKRNKVTKKKKHDLIKSGQLSDYFWYVVPRDLYETKLRKKIPGYCGVICFDTDKENNILSVEEINPAPNLKLLETL